MMRIGKLFIIIAVIVSATSCSNYFETVMRSADVDLKYKAAFQYYNKGKFKKSAEIFENLILAMQGMPQEDTVQYYNAMSNYKLGDYITAETNFEKFITVFPRSPFTEEAIYLRIKCLYEGTYRYELDQTPTRRAMSIISEFMYEYPENEYFPVCEAMMKEFMERLDKKSFESAKLYYIIEDYQAAHYALKNVLKENADNIYREDVLYYTGLASYKYALHSVPSRQKERYLSFIDDYYNFVGEYPESSKRKELDGYYERALFFTKKADIRDESKRGELTKADKKEALKQNKAAKKEISKADKLKREAAKNVAKEDRI